MPYYLQDSWKYTRLLMVLLRCALTISYLWAMLQAAAVLPVLNEKSSGFFRMDNTLWITYSSLLPLNIWTQLFIILLIFAILFRIYQCCRCKFCDPPNENTPEGPDLTTYRRLIIFYGPYMIIFVLFWLCSMHCIGLDLMRLYNIETVSMSSPLCYQMGMTVLFKILVLFNGISRSIRTCTLLKVFADGANDVCNVNSLGEHLNLFFHQ